MVAQALWPGRTAPRPGAGNQGVAMRKRGWVAVCLGAAVLGSSVLGASVVALAATAAPVSDLTPAERAWLQAALPVLRFARQQALPLDVIVQPQPTPGESPVGLAYLQGRCKLVLSMRGNPEADRLLARVPAPLVGPVVEAMAAHELAHCWRHVSGAWGRLPPHLHDVSRLHQLAPAQADLLRDMWRTRREEGLADLVGLAWTLEHHPGSYAAVRDWHLAMREHQPVDTGPHDTRVWLQLAADPTRFGVADTVFTRVLPLWQAGLQPVAPAAGAVP